MYEHLLVPVDGSELSNKAIEHSIGLAKMLGAAVTGFTAEPPLPVLVVEQAAVAYDVATFQEHEKRCEAHAREILEGFAAKAKEAGVHFDGQFMITDNVQQGFVDTAQRQGDGVVIDRMVCGPFGSRDAADKAGKKTGLPYWIYEGAP